MKIRIGERKFILKGGPMILMKAIHWRLASLVYFVDKFHSTFSVLYEHYYAIIGRIQRGEKTCLK